jgi:uncharacterized membrane protein
MLPFLYPKHIHFISESEKDEVLKTIATAEENTSGEIRLYIESTNPLMDPLERAAIVFSDLKMQNTENRNAVLIYIAYTDKEFALYGDAACYNTFPKNFWHKEALELSKHFYFKKYKQGLIKCVQDIGASLHEHFPQNGHNKNALPDEIVFGK